jgi:hypothetical protein
MGVVISKPAINIREQLTELKAQQGYEEQQFHFDGLVTNGTFDTDTSGWTAGNGATLSVVSGALRITNDGSTTFPFAVQTITTVPGQTYVVSATAVTTAYNWYIEAASGTTSASASNTTATKSLTFTAGNASTTLKIVHRGSSSTTQDFDNISVYEIDPADNKVIHTMPKGWKPLHVFEDGALQREGSAYDYTVEYDGFNYIVKETVAPVAPYSTTVIGVRA